MAQNAPKDWLGDEGIKDCSSTLKVLVRNSQKVKMQDERMEVFCVFSAGG
jgi:hypothetical protein